MHLKKQNQRLNLLKQETSIIPVSKGNRLRVVLLYPAPYSVAMANLGFHLIYRAFNEVPGVSCHRAFTNKIALTERETRFSDPVVSLESGEPLSRYDVIAVTLNYENDVLNLFRVFRQSGIPVRSTQRNHRDPIILAGGVILTINPEPLADAIDISVSGEAEDLIPELSSLLMEEWVRSRDRFKLLNLASNIPGIYIPSFYTPVYNKLNRFEKIQDQNNQPPKLTKRIVKNLDDVPASSVIHTLNSEFSGIHLVEISRGCPRNCHFCLIPRCYSPFRYRSVEAVLDAAKQAPEGWRIGLLGAGAADHPALPVICEELIRINRKFSFSSLHASGFTPELADLIRRGGPKTVTLAPEVALDNRRRSMGKSIKNSHLFEAINLVGKPPLKTIKVYFMVGLPGETEKDLKEIAVLCSEFENQLRQTNLNSRTIPRLSAGISCFVPKAQSPFERAPLLNEKTFKKKLKLVASDLKKIKEMSFNHDVPKWSVIQGYTARTDRRFISYFEQASREGANWLEELRKVTDQIHLDTKLTGPLPWDHLKTVQHNP